MCSDCSLIGWQLFIFARHSLEVESDCHLLSELYTRINIGKKMIKHAQYTRLIASNSISLYCQLHPSQNAGHVIVAPYRDKDWDLVVEYSRVGSSQFSLPTCREQQLYSITYISTYPLSPLASYSKIDKMVQKCVHKGCEKMYTDPEEECKYHPGPPVFHEGLKGM